MVFGELTIEFSLQRGIEARKVIARSPSRSPLPETAVKPYFLSVPPAFYAGEELTAKRCPTSIPNLLIYEPRPVCRELLSALFYAARKLKDIFPSPCNTVCSICIAKFLGDLLSLSFCNFFSVALKESR